MLQLFLEGATQAGSSRFLYLFSVLAVLAEIELDHSHHKGVSAGCRRQPEA
jgi:hypothetical protein